MAEIDALRAAFVIHRGDRAVRRPPMPAKLVKPARQRRTRLAQRERRHHRFMRRIGGIAGQAGYAHHPVVLGVERLQGRVVDRPVIGDAVQRARAKIRRMEPREVTRVQHRAAADAVEVGDLDRRIGVIDRIVGIARSTVRAGMEIVELPRLPVASGAGIFGWLHPVALLKAEDVHLRLGQAPGHGRAGGTGANDQDVNRAGHAKEPHLKCVAAINGGPSGVVNGRCLLRLSARRSELAYGPPVLSAAPNIPLEAHLGHRDRRRRWRVDRSGWLHCGGQVVRAALHAALWHGKATGP